MSEQNQQIYGFDNFRLDVPNRKLLRDGRPVFLQAKAFDMLVVLIENGGRLVGKDQLFSAVWPDQIVEESNLTVQVSAIRRALGDNKDYPHYIITVPGHGYRFTTDVRSVDEEEQEMVIERHSLSRMTIESERERAPYEAITLAKAPSLASSGNGATEPAAEPNAFRDSATAALVLAANRRQFSLQWFGVGAAIVVSALAVVLYREWQPKSSALPFQQITVKRLTNSIKAENAALSPDGKMFVYSLYKDGQRSLWLGHVTGGEPIALHPFADVSYRSLNFSPDSNSVYYVIVSAQYPRGALFRVPVFGSPPEKLREGVSGSISFAPDMKQFAFVRRDEEKGTSTLFITATDSSIEHELASRALERPFVGSPAWSPDGKTIAVGAVSTDETTTACEVFLVPLVDGQPSQLTKQRFGDIRRVAWGADGGLIIIAIEGLLKDAQIWHVSFLGGEVRRINPDLNDYYYPLSMSADGSELLAVQEQSLANIWVAPSANLSQAKRITFGSIGRREGLYGLDWMSGGKIIFSAVEDKSQALWLMNADGSDQKQLTSAGYVDEQPDVTADGRFVVFMSNRSGSREVWRVNADGSDLRQMTFGGNNIEPSVSPEGQWVVYISTRQGLRTLWRIPLAGGEPFRLSDRPVEWPRVSPDGKSVACVYTAATGTPRTKLAIIPIAGGQPMKLFNVAGDAAFHIGFRWTPDGAAITYRDWVNGIWRQPVAGGEAQRLAGLPEEKVFPYAWSHDGRLFAFARGAQPRDVVLIRDMR
jgi:eukaryotic-like serine/threonine-protein kinase